MKLAQSVLQIYRAANEDIIMAMESNFYENISYIPKKLNGADVVDNDYLLALPSGIVGRARFINDETKIKNVIDLVIRYYNVSDFSWYITPNTQPANLSCLLNKTGFQRTRTESGMAFNLKSSIKPVYENVSLLPIDSWTSLEQFDRLYAEIWNPQLKNYYTEANDILLQKDCPLKLYIGYAHGQPVAIYELYFCSGIVGIYSLGVVEKMRRQGLASHFLLMQLADLAQRGYEIVTLQATPAAINLYKRLGFKEMCQFHVYKLKMRD